MVQVKTSFLGLLSKTEKKYFYSYKIKTGKTLFLVYLNIKTGKNIIFIYNF